jgi:Mitochondrial ATP synthase B chain precursor (ATP-synt_B)
VQRQKVTVATEVKSVLDSWVRYEQQMKESEQAELTKTVINKVLASIKDEKTQKEILLSAVAEVEREWIAFMLLVAMFLKRCSYRTHQEQSYLDVMRSA